MEKQDPQVATDVMKLNCNSDNDSELELKNSVTESLQEIVFSDIEDILTDKRKITVNDFNKFNNLSSKLSDNDYFNWLRGLAETLESKLLQSRSSQELKLSKFSVIQAIYSIQLLDDLGIDAPRLPSSLSENHLKKTNITSQKQEHALTAVARLSCIKIIYAEISKPGSITKCNALLRDSDMQKNIGGFFVGFNPFMISEYKRLMLSAYPLLKIFGELESKLTSEQVGINGKRAIASAYEYLSKDGTSNIHASNAEFFIGELQTSFEKLSTLKAKIFPITNTVKAETKYKSLKEDKIAKAQSAKNAADEKARSERQLDIDMRKGMLETSMAPMNNLANCLIQKYTQPQSNRSDHHDTNLQTCDISNSADHRDVSLLRQKFKTLKNIIQMMDAEIADELNYSSLLADGISARSIIELYAKSKSSASFNDHLVQAGSFPRAITWGLWDFLEANNLIREI